MRFNTLAAAIYLGIALTSFPLASAGSENCAPAATGDHPGLTISGVPVALPSELSRAVTFEPFRRTEIKSMRFYVRHPALEIEKTEPTTAELRHVEISPLIFVTVNAGSQDYGPSFLYKSP